MKAVSLAFLAVLAMVLVMARPGEGQVSCDTVSSSLRPCLSYLSGGGKPSAECCSGVKNLSGQLKTKQDRQAACNCAKSAAANYPNLKPDAAQNLPQQCGVSINIPISRTVDCSKIS